MQRIEWWSSTLHNKRNICVMATRDIAGYLNQQRHRTASDPELSQEWILIEELYNKKLWHQLTLKLLQFIKHPYFSEDDRLLKFYREFIIDFEHRMNPLALMEIVIAVSKKMTDLRESLKFLEKMKESVKISERATVLCMTAMGNAYVQLQEYDKAKEVIKEADELVNQLDGVTSVHQRFYELSSNYYKMAVDYASYYRDSLRYLGCIKLTDVPEKDLVDRAFSLCLAAILGENVYNFGELLAHPVLNLLDNPEQQWLVELLRAFNMGNIQKFKDLKPKWKEQNDLAKRSASMEEKISMLCLMEMTFKRPANHRQLTFEEISVETHKPIVGVELLIMKALSLGLVKGLIDGVEQKVHMSWVQPRVLDKEQIKGMKERMKSWLADVDEMQSLVEANAQDILT